jgi:hypothetical protein
MAKPVASAGAMRVHDRTLARIRSGGEDISLVPPRFLTRERLSS